MKKFIIAILVIIGIICGVFSYIYTQDTAKTTETFSYETVDEDSTDETSELVGDDSTEVVFEGINELETATEEETEPKKTYSEEEFREIFNKFGIQCVVFGYPVLWREKKESAEPKLYVTGSSPIEPEIPYSPNPDEIPTTPAINEYCDVSRLWISNEIIDEIEFQEDSFEKYSSISREEFMEKNNITWRTEDFEFMVFKYPPKKILDTSTLVRIKNPEKRASIKVKGYTIIFNPENIIGLESIALGEQSNWIW